MKRSAKICLGIAALFLLVLFSAAVVSLYFVLDYSRGIRFANAGYGASQQGDFATAFSKYDAALRCRLDNANLAVAYCGRGIAQFNKKQLDAAISDLTESIRRFPRLAQAFYYRGAAYHQKDDIDHALIDYSEAIQIDPNLAYALLARGRILLQKGAVDAALADFDEAVRANPADPQPLIDRGLAYQRKGYFSSALASFESAVRLDPRNEIAQSCREEITSGRATQNYASLAALRKPFRNLSLVSDGPKLDVQALPPSDWIADDSEEQRIAYDFLLRGLHALEKKSYQEAVRFFTAGLEHHPAFENARALLCDRGSAYDRLHMGAKALQDYDRAIELDPEFVEAYYNRALLQIDQGHPEKAMQDVSAAIRLNPKYTRAYLKRALLFGRRGEITRARADYATAARTIDSVEATDRHRLLNDFAWMRATSSEPLLRDGPEAVAMATKACDLSGWCENNCIDTLAAAYAEAGNFDAAIKYQLWVVSKYDVPNDQRAEMKRRLKLYERLEPYHQSPNE